MKKLLAILVLMLMSSVAFGLEKLLLTMGSNTVVSAAVTTFALAWIVLFAQGRASPPLTRFLLVLIFVRFVMPVTMIASDQVFQHWLSGDYAEGQIALDTTTREIRAFEPSAVTTSDAEEPATNAPPVSSPAAAHEDAPGTLSRLWEAAKSKAADLTTAPMAQMQQAMLAQYEALAQASDRAARRMVDLIVVFLMQTLVVPLLLLWLLYRLLPGRTLRHAR